jgi:hypothetical protein
MSDIINGAVFEIWSGTVFLFNFVTSLQFIIGSIFFGSFGLIMGGCLAAGKREDLEREILNLKTEKTQEVE